ncbi:hypothetical protein ANN_08031 [Periplaneta americana]|uniref:Uncharacterized protein n=1 Tax=Periplaneta americana TaxID=6978 RepID=A0ABQ8T092_PERAM|nr:hypothetical protein ANN_08031 [Periplaneta americana]
MAGLCEGGNKPPGSLKAISKSLYRRPPEATGSLDRPPWNVVKRRWMASAKSTRGGPTRGRSFALDRQGGLGGSCRSRNDIVRNGTIKVGDLSFEEAEKFKYLGATVTNVNDTREEIKRRINMGNACYYSVEKLLSSSLLSKI